MMAEPMRYLPSILSRSCNCAWLVACSWKGSVPWARSSSDLAHAVCAVQLCVSPLIISGFVARISISRVTAV